MSPLPNISEAFIVTSYLLYPQAAAYKQAEGRDWLGKSRWGAEFSDAEKVLELMDQVSNKYSGV